MIKTYSTCHENLEYKEFTSLSQAKRYIKDHAIKECEIDVRLKKDINDMDNDIIIETLKIILK